MHHYYQKNNNNTIKHLLIYNIKTLNIIPIL